MAAGSSSLENSSLTAGLSFSCDKVRLFSEALFSPETIEPISGCPHFSEAAEPEAFWPANCGFDISEGLGSRRFCKKTIPVSKTPVIITKLSFFLFKAFILPNFLFLTSKLQLLTS
jgi:hypothetical protein